MKFSSLYKAIFGLLLITLISVRESISIHNPTKTKTTKIIKTTTKVRTKKTSSSPMKKGITFDLIKNPQINLEVQKIYQRLLGDKNIDDIDNDVIEAFKNEFLECDTDNRGTGTKEQFHNCIVKNKFRFSKLIPDLNAVGIKNNLALQGITDIKGYIERIFDGYSPKPNLMNYYDYLSIRYLNHALSKCTSGYFIYQKKFECLIEEGINYAVIPHNTYVKLFNLALTFSQDGEERYLDTGTFILISCSVRLFTKINVKNDFGISEREIYSALDQGLLPYRYNKNTIKEILKLTDSRTHGTIHSFVFYDIIGKVFMSFQTGRLNKMTLQEMVDSWKHIYFPRRYLHILYQKDKAIQLSLWENMNHNFNKNSTNTQNKERESNIKSGEHETQTPVQPRIANLIFKFLSFNHDNYITYEQYAKLIRFYYLFNRGDKNGTRKLKIVPFIHKLEQVKDYLQLDKDFVENIGILKDLDKGITITPFYAFSGMNIDNILSERLEKDSEKAQITVSKDGMKELFTIANIPYISKASYISCKVEKKEYNWDCVRKIGYTLAGTLGKKQYNKLIHYKTNQQL